MRINPGIHVLNISPRARQLGIGSGSLLLRNLQDADVAFLGALRGGVPDGTEAAAASALRVPRERAAALIEALRPLLVPHEVSAPPVPSLRSERLAPDGRRLSAAYGINGEEPVRRRSQATVFIDGLGRAGALLARTLATAGVGRLLLRDPAVVAPADVGTAYAVTDIGMNRAAAVKRHLFRIDPTQQVLTVTDGGERTEPRAVDLAVTVRAVGAVPRGSEPGTSPGVPSLLLSVNETGWDVGPLLVPGATPCLECLDRRRADSDPGWYAAVEALAGQDRQRSGAGPVRSPAGNAECAIPEGEEAAGAALAAGAASLAALVFLDGINQPALLSAVLSLRTSDGFSRLQELDYHPACGCRLQHRETRAGRPGHAA
ncbi:ThiF family adenylyltransferase [Arthrobacter zhangbolii]|uniref:ThiF family adenylyltransferase n=1 Tax=Arthrobacter zhangbolii TaxID=2886936 RepID=A0A9X1MAK3_9MICC|nr:ThiF family adenylyltransferase [Arthrobacter zhangbolii]MCC3273977.1 ThiF family adenylyltransferase [Arthrobacter zhangbolii]UON91292.1 ThiF family adenylyltransferase [Arthrobacter zhangbolii]